MPTPRMNQLNHVKGLSGKSFKSLTVSTKPVGVLCVTRTFKTSSSLLEEKQTELRRDETEVNVGVSVEINLPNFSLDIKNQSLILCAN